MSASSFGADNGDGGGESSWFSAKDSLAKKESIIVKFPLFKLGIVSKVYRERGTFVH